MATRKKLYGGAQPGKVERLRDAGAAKAREAKKGTAPGGKKRRAKPAKAK